MFGWEAFIKLYNLAKRGHTMRVIQWIGAKDSSSNYLRTGSTYVLLALIQFRLEKRKHPLFLAICIWSFTDVSLPKYTNLTHNIWRSWSFMSDDIKLLFHTPFEGHWVDRQRCKRKIRHESAASFFCPSHVFSFPQSRSSRFPHLKKKPRSDWHRIWWVDLLWESPGLINFSLCA